MGGRSQLARLILEISILLSPGAAFAANGNDACLDCHSDKTLTSTNSSGKVVSLFVDVAKLATSAHKTNSCASCHSDITAKHPDDNVAAKTVNCAKCHERE